MKVTGVIENPGHVYQKEFEGIECPVCHKTVDVLMGEDEGGSQPDRGRKGCEECWLPFKYGHGEVYSPPEPSQIFEGINPTSNSTQDVLADLKRSL
jgi:hypothetical protein